MSNWTEVELARKLIEAIEKLKGKMVIGSAENFQVYVVVLGWGCLMCELGNIKSKIKSRNRRVCMCKNVCVCV